MNAHLISYPIKGMKPMYMVVFDPRDILPAGESYLGTLVGSLEEAFDLAASRNAALFQDGDQLLEGDFTQ